MKIIAGMHRSGTSIVARLLHEAGADLGDPSTFYPPDKWNPDGYFEQPEFHAVNHAIINGPFGKLSYFRLPSTETLSKRAQRHAMAINRVSDRYRGKIVKEVRFCLTLPGWQAQGATFERVLICLREPYDVIRSVLKRYPIGKQRAYRLWHLHNERLLAHTEGIPQWFISYEALRDGATRKRELCAALDFMGVDYTPDRLDNLTSLIREPRFSVAPEEPLNYPPAVARLWREVQERHRTQFDTLGVVKTDE